MSVRSELVAGWPALELANTVNTRPTPTRDTLDHYDDFVAWAIAAAVVPTSEDALLRAADETVRERVLRDARILREGIYRIFSAVGAGSPVSSLDTDDLLAMHLRALPFASLQRSVGGVFSLVWSDDVAVIGPLAQSAIDLLRDGPLEKVKECPSCGWLFLDRSRNGARRWCSMDTCGSRDKMRRYHRRRHAPTLSGSD